VAVHDGSANIEAEGRSVRMDLRPGDFEWHPGSLVHTITNVGSTPLDAVEFTWK
jgi:mannose-6-phosphate isomerase-like protein (cupin superfamily)